MPDLFRRCIATLLILTALPHMGCREQDEIRSYTVPAVTDGPGSELSRTVDSSQPSATGAEEASDQMLAAMVPGKDQAWFFKLTGPKEQVQSITEAVETFFAGIQINEETSKPKWELPDGWVSAGASGMRLDTLKVPAGESEQSLDLSVIGLPLVGDWQAQLLDNLNRWRGQMALPPLTADQLSAETTDIEDGPEGAVTVSLVGKFGAGSMMPAGRPPFAGGANATSKPPASSPEVDSPIKYDLPEGWVKLPARPPRLINLRTADAANSAEVTGMVFPAKGAMGDLLANVNRWRGQVGLPNTDGKSLDAESEAMEVDGSKGSYVELIGEVDGILVAMAERDGGIWFLKLMGPKANVEAERENFRAWVKSLEIRRP